MQADLDKYLAAQEVINNEKNARGLLKMIEKVKKWWDGWNERLQVAHNYKYLNLVLHIPLHHDALVVVKPFQFHVLVFISLPVARS